MNAEKMECCPETLKNLTITLDPPDENGVSCYELGEGGVWVPVQGPRRPESVSQGTVNQEAGSQEVQS